MWTAQWLEDWFLWFLKQVLNNFSIERPRKTGVKLTRESEILIAVETFPLFDK